MPKESNLEFKVGLFVLMALMALTVFIFSITDSSVFSEGKTLRVVFEFANGLKENAPVRIAGVDEGIVKDVSLFFDREDSKTKAEVELWVKEDTKIPSDSVITINQLGLLGEKYIEIVPGTDTKQFLEEKEIVLGKNPIPQEAISERVLEVATQVEDAITGINSIINDQENQQAVHDTLKNISLLTGGVTSLVSDMKSGKGTIGKLFYDEQLYNNLQGFTSDIKENPWKLLYRPKDKDRKRGKK